MISRCRFLQIKRYLNFNNEDLLANHDEDRLFKIRPVYDLLTERWQSLYHLSKHVTIDIGMVKWRGKLSFRVYKDKPTTYGIKIYILADSQSKYCWNIDVYHGMSEESQRDDNIFAYSTEHV